MCVHALTYVKVSRGLNWAQSWVESAEAAISSLNNHMLPACLSLCLLCLSFVLSLFLIHKMSKMHCITFYMICSINLHVADNNSSFIRALVCLSVSSELFCGNHDSAVIQCTLLMACLCNTEDTNLNLRFIFIFWHFLRREVKWSLPNSWANHRLCSYFRYLRRVSSHFMITSIYKSLTASLYST